MLWASPATQAARFGAIRKLAELQGRVVLDVGCGRADLLDDLLSHGIRPAHYHGIEAVPELCDVAEAKARRDATIIRADFVRDPTRMSVGADVVIFSGSLNTLDADVFEASIAAGYHAARRCLVFNFLASPMIAARDYLRWHRAEEVAALLRSIAPASSATLKRLDDYLAGDCTFALEKNT